MEQVNKVHQDILRTAAEIANADESKPISGQPFREASGHSRLGGLCLDYDEGHLDAISDPHMRIKVAGQMRIIGQRAIRRAVILHGDDLAGLIVGDAREGRNYFDRFSEDTGPQPI